MDALDGETQLRSKKELIERFISDYFRHTCQRRYCLKFHNYWEVEKQKALIQMAEEEISVRRSKPGDWGVSFH